MDSTKPVKFTIYCHVHTESGRRYVGLTVRGMMRRWSQHVSQSKHAKKLWHFPNAIRKYGKDAFFHEVLKICSSLEEANAYEDYFIDLFRTRDPECGFNPAKGGAHTPHPVKNPWDRPDFREKALQSLAKANAVSPAVRSNRSKELWQDPDFREKISAASKRVMSDPDMKKRLSAVNKLAKSDPAVKARASATSKSMWQSEDYRAKNAQLWQDSDFRDRCQTGLTHGASLNKNKTRCPRGHEYSSENTFVNSKGSRECLICSRESKKQSARKKRRRKIFNQI